jgi:hypothetical protein
MTPVSYKLPDQLTDARFKTLLKAQSLVQSVRTDSRKRLCTAIHEAGHFRKAQQFGLTPRYVGQAIEYVSDTDGWITRFGAVQVPLYPYLELTLEQMADFHVAGKVVEIALLGVSPDKASVGSQSDYEQFIYSGFAGVSELILAWKRAEESAIQELRADLGSQQAIIHESARAEQSIFGPDQSIRRTL